MTKQVQHPVSLRQVEHDIRRQAGIGIAVGAGTRWESPDVPAPQADAGLQAGQQRLEDDETAAPLVTESPRWQVRVELGSHRQAVALAQAGRPELGGRAALEARDGRGQRRRPGPGAAGQIRQEAPPDAVITTGLAGAGWPFMPS